MNKRQFKKVHCLVAHNGRTMHINRRVPCRDRKKVRAWISSVLKNEDVMICLHMQSKYGVDIKKLSYKELTLKIAEYYLLEHGWSRVR